MVLNDFRIFHWNSHDISIHWTLEVLTAQEIIVVNQAWAGHSGSPFKQADSYVQLTDFNMEMKGAIIPHNSQVQPWVNGVRFGK